MKALMGKIAEEIRKDSTGKEELRRFIKSRSSSKKIRLSNGKTYTITSEKRAEPA
ncbi:hypothetical protein QX220_21535 [Vibrio vulnificus]|uniref:hypothetical protein n=1 Tax=Vibrio TaxID=662 RepID=UPI0015586761|nr:MULTISPECIES: hypothetical protein [Vibrio]EKF9996766.1 hypothetical protein [Vibrio cholerae]EKG0024258.1 hypothetical protein [Vibrio cholerae]ELO1779711.1 hypothetical protein [Vibrio fluvialis]MDS1864212.1 hypothetical protein [Vibrio vulnificus]QKU80125.1 hypothetical protein HPY08_14525 [Vibrio cholerae]